jgi:hypothetical protein
MNDKTEAPPLISITIRSIKDHPFPMAIFPRPQQAVIVGKPSGNACLMVDTALSNCVTCQRTQPTHADSQCTECGTTCTQRRKMFRTCDHDSIGDG